MFVLVVYDVNTEMAAGRRRLRQVADTCEGYGQRVQDSVFECQLQPETLQELVARLLELIDKKKDSLRVYQLRGSRDEVVRVYGVDRGIDAEKPLII